jgi:hypothetical protein
MTKLKAQLKGLAKRSRFIVALYRWLRFFRGINGKDLWSLVRDIAKTKLILTVKPYTMLAYPRLSTLYKLASRFERGGVSGSFIECGVCNGGSAAVIAAAARDNDNRHIWLFDSWEGLPEPGERDIAYNLDKAFKGGNPGT